MGGGGVSKRLGSGGWVWGNVSRDPFPSLVLLGAGPASGITFAKQRVEPAKSNESSGLPLRERYGRKKKRKVS